jgi:sodium/hydrogen exchanger 8
MESGTEQFAWENGAFLIQLVCLASALVMGLVMKHHRVHYIPEAGATLLLGIFVGLVMWSADATQRLTQNVDFNEEIFFFLLLPPIIFESGFSLETKSFFRNFDGICALAFGGTLISTIVVGVFCWVCGAIGLVTALSITHALVFGALVSATDPVSVLAVFQELGVNPDLFALVFGESVLNDAVAIVLYRTLLDFADKGASASSVVRVFESVGYFLFVFLGSTATGAAFAVLAAAFFRGVKGSAVLERHAHVETSLVMIAPYCAYAAAEFLQLSGIVAILFCGVAMAHYARPNLSSAARRDSAVIFKTLATLAETFVFLYMGVSLFLEDQAWSTVPFALAALCACLLARALNVYPMTRLVNRWRRERFKVPANHQNALFVSGLRGAVAFALASSAVRDLGGAVGRVIRTATLMLVIFTVLVVGGACHSLVDWLELRAPSAWLRVDDDDAERRVVVEGDGALDAESARIRVRRGRLDARSLFVSRLRGGARVRRRRLRRRHGEDRRAPGRGAPHGEPRPAWEGARGGRRGGRRRDGHHVRGHRQEVHQTVPRAGHAGDAAEKRRRIRRRRRRGGGAAPPARDRAAAGVAGAGGTERRAVRGGCARRGRGRRRGDDTREVRRVTSGERERD